MAKHREPRDGSQLHPFFAQPLLKVEHRIPYNHRRMPDDAPIVDQDDEDQEDEGDEEPQHADDRLRAATNLRDIAACMQGILLDGIEIVRDEIGLDESRDQTGCRDYLFRCFRSTFEFTETKEETRLMRYTFAIFMSDPINRDRLVGLMQDNWLTREIIIQQGDADGSAADLLCKIRMRARGLVKAVLDEIDRQNQARRDVGETVEDSPDDEPEDEDEITRAMRLAQLE